jgi:hypothetical protein
MRVTVQRPASSGTEGLFAPLDIFRAIAIPTSKPRIPSNLSRSEIVALRFYTWPITLPQVIATERVCKVNTSGWTVGRSGKRPMMGWTPRDGIDVPRWRVWPAKRRLPPARLARERMRPARSCFESDCAAAILCSSSSQKSCDGSLASSHYWARELSRLGHEVQLIPPSYVKPFGKRQKIRTRFVCQKQLAWSNGP